MQTLTHFLRILIFSLLGWATAMPTLHVQPQKNNLSATPRTAQTVIIQLKWLHKFQFAGYYAALHKGFYRDEGFEVQLSQGGPGISTLNEVLSGKATYGIESGELIYHRLNDKPVIALASIYQHSPSVLITTTASQLLTPHDLANKKVGMKIQGQPIFEIAAMFIHEGMSLNSLHLQDNLSPQQGFRQLIDQTIDADYGYFTSEPFIAKQYNAAFNYIRPITYGIDFYGDTLFTSEQTLRQNPAQVASIRRATLKGWDYAMRHPQEIIDLILQQYPNSAYDRAFLTYEAEQTRKLMQPDIVSIGHMNPDRWGRMADIIVSLGMADSTRQLKGFLYDPEQDEYAWVWSLLTLLAAVLLVFSLIGLTLILLNRHLHKSIDHKTERLTHEVERRTLAEQKLNHYTEVLEERYFRRTEELAQQTRKTEAAKQQAEQHAREQQQLIEQLQEALQPTTPDQQANQHLNNIRKLLTAHNAPAAAATNTRPKVLLVEDDELNQIVAHDILAGLNVQCTVTDSGKAALHCLQQQTFDLIFMDISMPDMDGYETTARIRASGIHTPVIALTAHANKGINDKIQRAGMDDCVTKPISTQDLQTCLETWL